MGDLNSTSVEKDTKKSKKKKERRMILKVMKTIISMLFKWSCVWGKKIISKFEKIPLRKKSNIFLFKKPEFIFLNMKRSFLGVLFSLFFFFSHFISIFAHHIMKYLFKELSVYIFKNCNCFVFHSFSYFHIRRYIT